MSGEAYLVIDRPEESRFVLERNGEAVGSSSYERRGGVIAFTHTEVDPAEQEHGLGSRLVAGALDAVRVASEDRVAAECPFVAHFVRAHPEYADLLTR
ncbi:MAG: N-acetyltransferase [Micrococcales bacterium]|nr:N-acetyltransferase [Micrococcales bacterium]